MKKIFRFIVIAAVMFSAAGCIFNDQPLQDRLTEISQRIQALQSSIGEQNTQISSLRELLSGNVITSMEEVEGKYVITYLDEKGEEKTVVLATEDQMINSPILGVRKDDAGVYYWTITVAGSTSDLKDGNGNIVPVAGPAPVISVSSDGYWMVNEVVVTDPDGKPVPAGEGENAAIKDVKTDADGNLVIVLGDSQSVTIPVQKALNLKLSCEVSNVIVDLSKDFEIGYEVEGSSAASALVDIADASGVKATLKKEDSKVLVSFDENFEGGRLVLFAYDLKNTVIRPIFFEKAAETKITITNAAQLKAFAARVNAQDGAESLEVVLESDIDLGGEEWTPVGNGTATTAAVIAGPSFKGKFIGKGHTIDNFVINVPADAADGQASGLFGVLDGAQVSGVKIGSKASIKAASAKLSHNGLVAGYALNSVVENCQNNGSISLTAVTNSIREVAAGIVASMYTKADAECVVRKCVNNGTITSVNTVNTNNGGTGLSVGGIVGFADGKAYNIISECTNNAAINAQATRLAGVVATANAYTKVQDCVNKGEITDTDVKASNSRVGGICSAASTETYFTRCVNYGDVLFAVAGDTTHGYVAGILGQSNNPVVIEACENYGTILSDMYKASLQYMGIIVANFNSKAATAKNNKLGGKIGPYTEDDTYKVVTLTEENYLGYLTLATSKAESAITENNVFAGEPAPIVGIASVDDLLEFRDSVNAGSTFKKFQDETGAVVLVDDIDCSAITEWIPIGNPATVTNANTACSYTGSAFKGVFDGKGHSIYNIKLTKEIADAGTFGLFGVLDGATVKNLVLGMKDDASAFTVSSLGTADAGVLAGTVTGQSIISNCTNNIPVTVEGGASGKRFAVGAFVGFACSQSTTYVQLSELINNAAANISSGKNTANGATCVMYGGIGGFFTGTTAGVLTTVENCRNNGDITSQCGRSSGLVATCNTRTFLRYCTNYGNQVNTFTNARIGNLTCVTGAGCALDDCTNYGNLTTTDSSTTTGGMIALLNGDDDVVTGGGNYGTIIGANEQYHGLLVANFSKFSKVDGVFAGGACGTYVSGSAPVMHELTKENFMNHIGSYKVEALDKITNIGSDFGTGGGEVQPVVIPDATLRILCIGNSFTKDAVEHVPGLLAAAGEQNVVIAHCYYGGRTVPEYNTGWSIVGDYTLYISKPNFTNPDASTWETYSRKVTLKEVAEQGRWDIVTIQEHTGNYRAWSWTQDEKSAVQGLIDKVKATQSTAPKFWYIMSQAYFNMSKIGSGSQPYITWTDQAGMYAVIVAQGKKVMDETTMDGVIATGTYLQNLRSSSIDNTMNLTRDGYHMDYGITRYGAACCVFESLITPFDGKKLDGNTYRYSSSSTSDTAYSTPVTDTNAPFALAAARYAIENPWKVTDMSDFGKDNSGKIDDLQVEEGEKE